MTGGDSGIGRAVLLAYAREGADVLFTHLPAEEKDAAEPAAPALGRVRRPGPEPLGFEPGSTSMATICASRALWRSRWRPWSSRSPAGVGWACRSVRMPAAHHAVGPGHAARCRRGRGRPGVRGARPGVFRALGAVLLLPLGLWLCLRTLRPPRRAADVARQHPSGPSLTVLAVAAGGGRRDLQRRRLDAGPILVGLGLPLAAVALAALAATFLASVVGATTYPAAGPGRHRSDRTGPVPRPGLRTWVLQPGAHSGQCRAASHRNATLTRLRQCPGREIPEHPLRRLAGADVASATADAVETHADAAPPQVRRRRCRGVVCRPPCAPRPV